MSDLGESGSNSVGLNADTSTSIAVSSTQVQIADYQAFVQYLKQFVPVLLDTNNLSIIDFEKCLNDNRNAEIIKKFMSDQQVRSLVIQKNLTKGNNKNNNKIL
jgi:hypothetical protein